MWLKVSSIRCTTITSLASRDGFKHFLQCLKLKYMNFKMCLSIKHLLKHLVQKRPPSQALSEACCTLYYELQQHNIIFSLKHFKSFVIDEKLYLLHLINSSLVYVPHHSACIYRCICAIYIIITFIKSA